MCGGEREEGERKKNESGCGPSSCSAPSRPIEEQQTTGYHCTLISPFLLLRSGAGLCAMSDWGECCAALGGSRTGMAAGPYHCGGGK